MEARVREHGLPPSAAQFRMLKAMGFSDERLATLAGLEPSEVAAKRRALDIHPVYKRIDTCAAEFASPTAYMYSTYECGLRRTRRNARRGRRRPRRSSFSAAARTGSARASSSTIAAATPPSRCPARATRPSWSIAIRRRCRPTTTPPDRLYFEPLTEEDVLEIVRKEETNGRVKGVIVQFGGQTPLKLAQALEAAKVPILGTSPDAIDLAEDRDRFKALIDRLGSAPAEKRHRPLAERSHRHRRHARLSARSFARLMCSAAGPWRSCTTMRSLPATSPRPWWSQARARC